MEREELHQCVRIQCHEKSLQRQVKAKLNICDSGLRCVKDDVLVFEATINTRS